MAANRIKGITLEIGGDTTGLNDALKNTNKQISGTQSQLKDVERLLKLDPTNVTLLEQKQRLLASAVEDTGSKLEVLKTASEQAAKSSEKYDEWKAAYDPIQSEIEETQKKLKALRDQQQELADGGGADTDAYKDLAEQARITAAELKDLKNQAKEVNDQFDNPISPDQYDALQREIIETEQKLQGLNSQAEETADKIRRIDEDPIEDVEKAARDAGDALEDAGDGAISFGDLLGADMIADAAGSIIESLGEVAEETKEYRKIMASLEESSADAGYSAGETADLFGKLNGVLGDTQAAATTTANLQALEVEQTKLQKLTDGVIGSWAKYGDSIPIDGLGEAVNHTAKLGEVQGVLADVLEWGGITVDEFNEQLAACNSTTERADLIAQMFADQGLTAMGEAWQKNNASMVASNEASANLQAQLARLGETVEPIFTGLTDLAAGFLGMINDGLDQMAQKTAADDLSDSMDGFATAMSTAAVATATTTAEVETSANMAKTYVDRLKELEAGGLDTADAQQEYAQTVELLNGLIPDLNLSIDETTGLLDQDTGSILENIQAWKDRATAQALQKQLTAEIEAQAEANAALYTAEQKKIELEAKEKEILRQLAEAQSKTGDAADDTAGYMNALAGAMAQGMDVAGGLTGDLGALGDASLGVSQEQAALEDELARVRSEMSDLDGEIEDANDLIAESEERIQDTTDAYGHYTEAMGEASEGHEEMDESIESTQAEIKALQEEYDNARKAARESVDSQIGIFDELETESEYTAQGIIDNWLAQQSAFDNYTANLQKAVEMNLPQELLDQLSDGSEESMLILDALVNDSEITADEITEAFGERCEARDKMVDQIAEMRTGARGQMKELIAEMRQAGSDLVDGAVLGVRENAYKFDNAMADLGRHGTGKFEEATMIGSPSKVMEDDGEFVVEGAVKGVRNLTDEYEATLGELAVAGEQAFVSEQPDVYYPSIRPTATATSTYSTVNKAYGGFEIHIHQQPGEDADALAYRTLEMAQMEVARKEAAL